MWYRGQLGIFENLTRAAAELTATNSTLGQLGHAGQAGRLGHVGQLGHLHPKA